MAVLDLLIQSLGEVYVEQASRIAVRWNGESRVKS